MKLQIRDKLWIFFSLLNNFFLKAFQEGPGARIQGIKMEEVIRDVAL